MMEELRVEKKDEGLLGMEMKRKRAKTDIA